MPQDAFTLRYLCQELNQILSGGKVNRITEPTSDQTVLTIYTGKKTEKLLIDVNPASPRMALIQKEKDSPLTAPNFCMLMRKHLLSATLTGIELIGFDRIVKITFLSSAEFFDSVEKVLYVELMGRYSNIILTEKGKILGGNRGINMFDNGVRPLIVSRPYLFPPTNDKLLPEDEKLIKIFDKKQREELVGLIVKSVQGIAMVTAQEIVNGYAFLQQNVDGQAFFNHLNDFVYSHKKAPCVIVDDGQIKDVCVYPYGCIKGQVLSFEKLYLAEEYYFENKERVKEFNNKKERLKSIVSTAVKKVKKRLTAISSKEKEALSAEENKILGELILANLYKIKKGDKSCTVINYYDGSQVTVSLDENLSPSKNAENYYKKYNKQKRTLVALKPQKEQAESELAYLNSVLDEIGLCEDIEDLLHVERELEGISLIKTKPQQKKGKVKEVKEFREYVVNGFKVLAGRNNTENDKVTFGARGEDIWLHAKDYHSSHLIIQTQGKEVDETVINICAQICAYYSKGREGGKTEIVYTKKKFVKKPKGAKPGFCTYTDFKSVVVEPKKGNEFIKSV